MIDLDAYPEFKRDIQSKQTNVYPLVDIGKDTPTDRSIKISTVKEYIDGLGNLKDYGLKLSNIKEIIDVKKKTFKIYKGLPSSSSTIALSDTTLLVGTNPCI